MYRSVGFTIYDDENLKLFKKYLEEEIGVEDILDDE
jgi:hypothetical protein